MKIIVCLDDRNGMLFNRRRLSRDQSVYQQMITQIRGARLWVSNYSFALFSECGGHICVNDTFTALAAQEDYCFVEDPDDLPAVDAVEELIIYRWNRTYPADVKFPLDRFTKTLRLSKCADFPGKSHDRITQEVYVR